MPAQIAIQNPQLETIFREARGNPVVICEGFMPGVLDVWVIDEESRNSDTHRSVLVDEKGNVLGDIQESDNA